ncbi:hypothetical protein mRhiFer1_009109 [Rhinolophus ferrumequinum]|uniref:Reverse transcriptase/retrotransposon-derived protein RNase H-like domain-containing protein n=1 Tax=Rhinolophus ferrumequinum TaxID=59479 RepID=A0A7J7SJ96_RHIFE|nr:hypothetical protein mRhiFer1_009109 [Rhinolophus ferrumequinum]
MHTHSPTWDDCQQLLKTLFTTEEREQILTEARKNVPGDNGRPTTLPNLMDERFPLNRPDWDFENAEGRERLRVYRQTLMAGHRAAARRPTNLAKSHNSVTLLQYVDNLLLAAPSEAECQQATGDLLQELGQLGYRASAKKAQICRQTVTYLGYKLKEGTRWLTEAMKETILRLPVPTSAREVCEFLGTTGYCRLWILGYAEIAKPLYEATKDKVPWAWGSGQQKAYDELKVTLLRAPALALPDPLKPFTLFVDERRGIAKGVLMQRLGPWKRPVAYLSKKLDPVAAGWPPCLRIIAAVALMVKDADKLTFGQHLKVVTPHAIEGVLKYPPGRWMTNARLTHYQGLLLDAPRIIFAEPTALNPATLLPTPDLGAPLHDCQEIMAEVT